LLQTCVCLHPQLEASCAKKDTIIQDVQHTVLALSTCTAVNMAALQDQAEGYGYTYEDLACSSAVWRVQLGEDAEDAGMFGYDASSSGSHCSAQSFTQLTVLGESIRWGVPTGSSSSGYGSSGCGSDDGSDGDSGCCSSSYALHHTLCRTQVHGS
jgi:hypothetical protein